jgi:hypothetical protein
MSVIEILQQLAPLSAGNLHNQSDRSQNERNQDGHHLPQFSCHEEVAVLPNHGQGEGGFHAAMLPAGRKVNEYDSGRLHKLRTVFRASTFSGGLQHTSITAKGLSIFAATSEHAVRQEKVAHRSAPQ